MNTEKVYILEDRGILYISGPDSEKFLQNLISNNIEKVNESKSCFASLLSPQGKFLFDFLVVKHKDGYFLDCEKKIVIHFTRNRENVERIFLRKSFFFFLGFFWSVGK